MRKVTQKSAEAMKNGYNTRSGNTEVISDGNIMNLHGNTIAIYDRLEGKLTLRDCGWKSATTKERLNGLLSEFHSEWRIYQKDGAWYITDGMGVRKNWDGFLVVEV